jgi:hypothetical protein
MCLDYIFEIFYEENIEEENFYKRKLLNMGDNVIIEPFFVKNYNHLNPDERKYTQLSDHYGLSFSIYYNGIYFI